MVVSKGSWPGSAEEAGPSRKTPAAEGGGNPTRGSSAGGYYCTACGTGNGGDAAFCDHCGLPMKRPLLMDAAGNIAAATVAEARPDEIGGFTPEVSNNNSIDTPDFAAAPSPPRPWTQRWVAPGAALASVLVLALGSVIWQAAAPPPTSEELLMVMRSAGNSGGAGSSSLAAPSPDLLCLRNLPYHRHHIQVYPSDQVTRTWLDALVQAGLYAPPVEVVPEGLSRETLLQYQALPAINPWRRAGGRLCVAQKWVLDSVLPNSIRKDATAQPPRYVASLVWRAEGVAPWLGVLPEVGMRLAGVRQTAEGLTTSTQQEVVQGGRNLTLVER